MLGLLGELRDSSSSSSKFRDFIASSSFTRQDLESWTRECLASSDRNHAYAFQDLVNEIGRKIGFRMESGFYVGRAGADNHDGVWTSPKSGIHLVVESKKSTAFKIDPAKVGEYIEGLASKRSWKKERTYGLFVIGEDKPGTLIDTIRGSDYRNSIRLVPIGALLRLLRMKEDTGLGHEKLVKLLVPLDAINIGELVDLVESITLEQTISAGTPRLFGDTGGHAEQSPLVPRAELKNLEHGDVVVCPSRPSGEQFLLQNNAWGYIYMARNPRYFALYIGIPKSEVVYFAEVDRVLDPGDPASPLRDTYQNDETFAEGKKLILLKKDTIKQLKDPIPIGEQTSRMQGLRYVALTDFLAARTVDDL